MNYNFYIKLEQEEYLKMLKDRENKLLSLINDLIIKMKSKN